ncbi:MAG: FtsX-like permease family protein [Chloroflexi bacterium]|nr:FtsX-like permease family protein [Chloroflexota bacterium]
MAFVRLLAWLTWRRAKARWRFLAAAALGVLLAMALASAAMLHSKALAEAGLRHSLTTTGGQEYLNLQVFLLDRPLGEKDYHRLDSTVGEGIQKHIAWLFSGMHRYGKTNEIPYVLNAEEAPPPRNIPLATPFFLGGLEDHAHLASGRWPGPAQVRDDGILALEGVVGPSAPRFIDLGQDTTIFLAPLEEAPQVKVAVTIVGIVEPNDSKEAYWFRDLSHFRVSFETEDEDGDFVVPIYIGEESFFKRLGDAHPLILGDYRWYVSLDYLSLTAATALVARQSLDSLEADLNKRLVRALAFSSLPGLVQDYQRNLALARVPLFMFVSMVVGVVLYYLVVTTSLQARERGAEAAVLRSRGASVLQAGGLLGLGEGLVTVLPGVLAGPPLGLLVARLMPIGGQPVEYMQPGLSASVFLAALAAGAACVLVFTATGIAVARGNIVGYLRERGRPALRSGVIRSSIDLVVLAALGLLWWQIRSRGGLLSRPLEGGGINVDLALLLGPAISLLALGLAMLRLVPALLRLLAKTGDRRLPPWVVHMLRRTAREPLAYGALAVLLMLAASLGVFGAAFGATLARGQADVTRYRIGGEVVASAQTAGLDIAGVQAALPVYRGRMGTATDPQGTRGYSLLAVDPLDVSKVAWFRDDFAGKPLEDLLLPLRKPSPVDPGIAIPGGATAIGLWVKGERDFSSYDLRLRIRDSQGSYGTLRLGGINSTGWEYLETPLPESAFMQPPLWLTGILIRGGSFTGYGAGWLALDDLSVVVLGEREVIDEFETAGPWLALPNLGTASDSLSANFVAAHTGTRGLLFSWTHPISATYRGMIVPASPAPLPALASPPFHVGQRLVAAIESQPVELVVEEVLSGFPTLYPEDTPFFIVSQDHMYLFLLSVGVIVRTDITELWLSLDPEADRTAVLAQLQEASPPGDVVLDREVLAAEAAGDPLRGGAWNNVALQGAIALGLTSLLGFGLYAGIVVHRSRLELGVLQALGFSRRQVALLLAAEGALIGVIGLSAGLVMGAWLSRWSLGFMSVTAGGKVLAPPLVLTTETWLLGLALAQALAAVLISSAIALLLARKLRLHEVLRVEE